jgi:hypothetical protein
MSKAQKEFEARIKTLQEAYKGTVVKSLRWDSDERSLSVRVVVEEESYRFSFYVPEDFPDMRPMLSIDEEAETEQLNTLVEKVNEFCEKRTSTITAIIQTLLTELSKIVEFEVPKVNPLGLSRSGAGLRRSALRQSTGGDDEGEEYEEEEYLDGVDEGGEMGKLVKHSKVAQHLFGAESILVYPFIDSVRLQLDVSVLSAEQKRKLAVSDEYHKNIVVSIQFGSGDYINDRRVPQVKVIHPKAQGTADQEFKSGLGEQIENVARQFLERVWPTLQAPADEQPIKKLMAMGYEQEACQLAFEKNNFDFEAASAWLTDNVPDLAYLHLKEKNASKDESGSKKKGKDKKKDNNNNNNNTNNNNTATTSPVSSSPPTATAGSVAVSSATDKGKGKRKDWSIFGSRRKDSKSTPASPPPTTTAPLTTTTSTSATSSATSSSSSSSSSGKGKKGDIEKQMALVRREEENISSYIKKGQHQLAASVALWQNGMVPAKAAHALIAAGATIEDAASLPDNSEERNMILELMAYLVRRMPTPIGYCLICDKPIVNDQITDPVICTMGTCQFNWIELGVCQSIPVTICPSSIANDIMNNPDVVDLYISMAVAAATSHRKYDIFNPFPPQFQNGDTKNFDAVVRVLNDVPSVDDMKKHCGSERQFITYLASIDPSGNLYGLLRWILSVNRSALLKMPPNLHIKEMGTKHQYIMTAGTNPEKTAQFKKWRKEYGSYFAFHGSGIENWHSILRQGLLNCSGTKLQTTGAAYGPGVYLAPDSGTSMGYARTGSAWSKSKFENSSSLVCMAIAEVVKHPEAQQTPNPYYVIRNADFVSTRFFMFYPGGMSGVSSVQASSLNLSKYV